MDTPLADLSIFRATRAQTLEARRRGHAQWGAGWTSVDGFLQLYEHFEQHISTHGLGDIVTTWYVRAPASRARRVSVSRQGPRAARRSGDTRLSLLLRNVRLPLVREHLPLMPAPATRARPSSTNPRPTQCGARPHTRSGACSPRSQPAGAGTRRT
jgi:hypothetical protein